jgi:galactonate dehydratase
MKITRVITYVVSDTALGKTLASQTAFHWVFVKVETDEGVTGWGEAGTSSRAAGTAMGTGIEAVKESIIGENPMDIERLWHKVYRRFSYMGARGWGTSLVAAFDTALWDIKGKVAGMPVYELLGGRFRDPISLYCNTWFRGCTTPGEYADAAKRNVTSIGHTACKLDPFLEMRPSHTMYQDGQISEAGEQEGYDIVAAVREAVGPKVEVLIDARGHFNVPTAIRLANNLYEQSNIGWFEEPVPPESFDALKEVREHTAAPICVGERLFTRYDFVPVFRDRLADYIMPDTIWTGGISEIKKIAAMAETYYIPISPHVVPGGPLGLIAAAHAVSSIPNFYRLEHSQEHIPIHDEMLDEPYEIKDGHMRLNGKPGLGYELNEEWLLANLHPDWAG